MSKRILIVEDTKNIREIVSYLLRNRGYDVITAEDGDQGWKMATEEDPDLIVLDAMLPGKTGFDICSDLKGDDKFNAIPVIMLTAITQDSGQTDKYWRNKTQADDFMSKPFTARVLVERVEKLLLGSAKISKTA